MEDAKASMSTNDALADMVVEGPAAILKPVACTADAARRRLVPVGKTHAQAAEHAGVSAATDDAASAWAEALERYGV